VKKYSLTFISILVIWSLNLILILATTSHTNASADLGASSEYTHYLPLVYRPDCIPRQYIPQNYPDIDREVENRINNIRDANQLSILVNAHELTQAALRHSNDMATNNFFSHTGSDGTKVGERVSDTCYKWGIVGEILAAGYKNSSRVINAWINSPGHREIIMDDSWEEFGSGYVRNQNSKYEHFWAVVFGLRRIEAGFLPEELHKCNYFAQDDKGISTLILYSSKSCEDLTPVEYEYAWWQSHLSEASP